MYGQCNGALVEFDSRTVHTWADWCDLGRDQRGFDSPTVHNIKTLDTKLYVDPCKARVTLSEKRV
jgi:hypothetical protein